MSVQARCKMNFVAWCLSGLFGMSFGIQTAHAEEANAGAAAVSASASESKPAEGQPSSLSPAEREAKRAKIQQMRDDTLKRLYKIKPEARAEIAKAAGYAVFDATQTNILLLVTSKGSGIVVDNSSNKETFMKMARMGTGPGVGHKGYKLVLVFKSKKLMEQFLSVGADVSASADATFKRSGSDKDTLDANMSANPNLSTYQFTDRGLILQANYGGVGYLPDSDLNDKPGK